MNTVANFNIQSSSRTWLSHLTLMVVKTRDELLAKASTEHEEVEAWSLSINDISLCTYQDIMDSKEWRTLQDWEQHGYKLKMNAKPVYVWNRKLILSENPLLSNQVSKHFIITVYNISEVERS